MNRPTSLRPAENTRRARGSGGARGFTLVELIVAVTAGLFVAIAAFALSRQGSRFFQQEARIANAQFAATLGFDRLRADIARAGFMTTPNIQRDPFHCGSPVGWPAGMASLASLRIEAGTPAAAVSAANGLSPDRITMSGSYVSAESFPVRTVVQENGKYAVYLQDNNGPIARSDPNGADAGTLGTIFKDGRVLRILDATGHYEFGAIDGYSVNASGQRVVWLKPIPAIAFRRQGTACGIEGLGVGMQANVVNTIRYELRDLRAAALPQYAALFAANSATAPGDDSRLELVRVELDANGNEMADSLELVAEYAVDLRFGLTVVSAFRTPTDPTLTELPIGDARVLDYTFDVATKTTTAGPERVRSVRARLAVRSREADRAQTLTAPAGNIFRYTLPNGGGFARARTLVSQIQLANLASTTW